MIDTKELRRLVQAALAAPDGLSAEWMDRLGQFQEAADASVVSELLDRLEATENDSAHHKALAESALRVAKGWEDKCDELRVKIESMEQQEPVAWYSKQYGFVYMSRHSSQFEHGSILYLRNGAPAWRIEGSSKVALLDMASLPHGTVFYALTGAKGE